MIVTLDIQGGDDSVVDKEVNIKFFKEIPATDKRIHIYPGEYTYTLTVCMLEKLINVKERDMNPGMILTGDSILMR